MTFFDSGDGVTREAVGYGVGSELSIFQPADAAAHRSGPNGSIRILVNGVDAILCEAISLGVGFGGK